MDSNFIYHKPATGKYFIGRTPDSNVLFNLLSQGENIVIYEPPKSGKTSLLYQTFFNMKIRRIQFSSAEYSFLNVRTTADLIMGLGSSIIKAAAPYAEEYQHIVAEFLQDTHFTFDREVYDSKGRILSLNWDIDDQDIEAILTLPYRIAGRNGQKLIVVLDEFQNIMETEDGEHLCKLMEKIFGNLTDSDRNAASYILSGSRVNAMKEIFEHRKFFYRQVERVKLSTIDPREIIDFAVKGFLSEGKVLDKNLMLGVCKLFKSNIWYINHFCSICDSLSKGYIMEPVLLESLQAIISLNEPKFQAAMNDLTTYQIYLLKAILEGQTRLSSSEVIRRYNLNSSANVLRLKDALCKKEIITFEAEDKPVILDPLFEYWVSKVFFEMKMD